MDVIIEFKKSLKIYFDDIQEGIWFKSLHPYLSEASLEAITGATIRNTKLQGVLKYDRPDIILTFDGNPILVLERTIEVPSGHNVGQRFARLAAAAEARVPLVYFGPYVARKHGGATEGPRYMNLRLFKALDIMQDINNSAITTINWPVDSKSEILQDPSKDNRVREYLKMFFEFFIKLGPKDVHKAIIESKFQAQQLLERKEFIKNKVTKPEQYDNPPDSVTISDTKTFFKSTGIDTPSFPYDQIVLYHVGMTYVRSDPYTGMALLYRYLYIAKSQGKTCLILRFPNITKEMWNVVAYSGKERKDVRIYKTVADGILFKDDFVVRGKL
ncbi:hypothetical protein PV433_11940 [Paenibacillus sp. GYB004]|uniref:hypothetical protein n=1 Tax=Paenibacillus sp. GYB004 TaxID=2994393 RepID=UPI002F9657D6